MAERGREEGLREGDRQGQGEDPTDLLEDLIGLLESLCSIVFVKAVLDLAKRGGREDDERWVERHRDTQTEVLRFLCV